MHEDDDEEDEEDEEDEKALWGGKMRQYYHAENRDFEVMISFSFPLYLLYVFWNHQLRSQWQPSCSQIISECIETHISES